MTDMGGLQEQPELENGGEINQQPVHERPDSTEQQESPQKASGPEIRHPYLPYLTTLLLIAMAAWFVKDVYLDRPSTEQQARINSFAAALELIPGHYVEDVSAGDLYRAAMNGMMSKLSDRYSTYLDNLEVKMSNAESAGEFGGIGVVVSSERGRVVITEVTEDSPADRAGLEAGDIIEKVDGEDTSEFSFSQVVAMVRGKVGTSVELTVLTKEGDKQKTVKVDRKKITLETVDWEMLEGDVGLLKLARFDKDTVPEVEEALEKLIDEGMKGLILDLRNNTGGLLDQAVGVCDLFLGDAVVVKLESRLEDERETYESTEGTAIPQDMPMLILVDGRTGSGAEIVAGALQSQERAEILGTTTFGKGAVNKLYPLPDGSGVLLTVAYYVIHPDHRIEGKGVEPDYKVGELPPFPSDDGQKEVRKWLEQYRNAHSKQLEKARQIIKEKLN